MLASVDLSADVEAIHASAAVQGWAFNASRDEIQAATTTVDTALQHPLLRRAVASGGQGNTRCETPVLLVLGDGSIAEGVLDLAFRKKTSGRAGAKWLARRAPATGNAVERAVERATSFAAGNMPFRIVPTSDELLFGKAPTRLLLGRKSVSVGLGETGTLVVLIAAPQSHAATQAD